jgi:hypothetical protein
MSEQKNRLLVFAGPGFRDFTAYELLNDSVVIVLCVPREVVKEQAVSWNDYLEHSILSVENKRALHLLLRVHTTCATPSNENALVVIVEDVPDAELSPTLAGHRIFFFCRRADWFAGDVIEDLISDAARRKSDLENSYYAKTQRVSPNAKRFLWHTLESFDVYLRMCDGNVLGQMLSDSEEARDHNLRAAENPANPCNVFNIHHAMHGIPNAHPEWCKYKNYFAIRRDGAHVIRRCFSFASLPGRRANVYRLTPAQAKPEEFLSCYLPHIQSKEAHSSGDKRLFYSSMRLREKIRGDIDEEEEDLDLNEEETLLQRSIFDKRVSDTSSFDYVVTSRTNPDLAWTIEKLAAKNQRRYDDIQQWRQRQMAERKLTLTEIAKGASDRRRALFKEQMEEFRVAIWSETANVSDELKHVIRWGEKYLETHKNFYRYRPKMTQNMSTSAEWALRTTYLAEHVLYIYNHHAFLILVLLQQFNAYDMDRVRKLYYLATGPPGSGKSVLLNWAKFLFIPLTVLSFTYETMKAKSGVKALPNGERTIDNSIMHCHEKSNDQMGIGMTANKGGPAADILNFTKSVMDSGHWTSRRSVKNRDTNDYDLNTVDVKCNMTEGANTNVLAHNIDAAIRDRTMIAKWTNERREDKDMMDVMRVELTSELQRMRDMMRDDTCVDQYMRALVAYLIETKIFRATREVVASQIGAKTLDTALESYGMQKEPGSRTIGRLTKMSTEQAVLTGIQHMLHAECSPIKDKAWDIMDIEGIVYWLRSNTQHAALSLGALKDGELEDQLQNQVLHAIEAAFFPTEAADVPMDGKEQSSSAESKKLQLARYFYRGQQLVATGLGVNSPLRQLRQDDEPNPHFLVNNDVFTARQALSKKPRASAAPESKDRDSDSAGVPAQNAETFTKFMSQDERLQKMARVIRTAIPPTEKSRPDTAAIVSVLSTLLKGHTTRTDDDQDVPTLELRDDGFVIATNAIAEIPDHPIESSLLDTLEHDLTPEGEHIAFTAGYKGKPHLFNVLKPKRIPKKKFQQKFPNYADEKERDVMDNITGLDEHGKQRLNLDEIYSRHARQSLDKTLDEVDLEAHLANVHWCAEDTKRWGWAPEPEMDKRYVEAAQKRLGKTLPIYPEEMSTFTQHGRKKGSKRKRRDSLSAEESPASVGLGLQQP